ncbi:hypothetical protein AX15_007521 [Amanita polypyramis BW_CC]|nr:hypothetical protein AX15_007521 [Amanita polypyramis BW_CC]
MSSATLTKAAREAVKLTTTTTTTTIKTVREALRIVQGVLKESLGPTNGLTSSEIFTLATRKPAPSLPSLSSSSTPPLLPPTSEHPVRSLRFLKRAVLPILEGNRVIQMKQIKRISSPLAATSSSTSAKKGEKQEATSSSAGRKIWAWTPVDPSTVPKPRTPESPKPNLGTAVGIGMDWSHLNTRRERARAAKVTRDYSKMKEALQKHGEKVLV